MLRKKNDVKESTLRFVIYVLGIAEHQVVR